MKAVFLRVAPYGDDALHLPVADIDTSIPFYTSIMGFEVVSRSDSTPRSVVLGRPEIQMTLSENGGDPTQDGVAFQVDSIEAALEEFKANGLTKELSDIKEETNDSGTWRVFYIIAPDGLCFWIGEKQHAYMSSL